MELRVLRYFLATVQYGNFSAAARSLNLTQPTLSRQIQELEAELGVELLIRGRRRLALTEAGKYFQSRATEIIELSEGTKNCLRGGNASISGEVNIAAGETRAIRFLANAIKKTRAEYPDIKFHIFSGNAEAVAARLDAGLSDLVFSSCPDILRNMNISLFLFQKSGACSCVMIIPSSKYPLLNQRIWRDWI